MLLRIVAANPICLTPLGMTAPPADRLAARRIIVPDPESARELQFETRPTRAQRRSGTPMRRLVRIRVAAIDVPWAGCTTARPETDGAPNGSSD